MQIKGPVPGVLAGLLFLLLGGADALALRIESPAFDADGKIPQEYTCDGGNVSPPLAWFDPPEGTRSFVLISDDPDAPQGTWVHWVIYNLPPEAEGLASLLTLPPRVSKAGLLAAMNGHILAQAELVGLYERR